MSPSDDRAFPCALTAVAGIAFDYADGDGVDCEPYDEFLSAEDTSHWLRGWTGNAGLDGNNFRVFGQDGAGGCVAFWRAPPGGALADQPVVLLGSEGELGVVAQDLASYLWLLSDGFSPWEAVESPERARVPARNCSPSLNGMPPEHADRQQRLLLQPGKSSLTSNKPLPRYADRPAPAVPGRRAETPEGLTGRLLSNIYTCRRQSALSTERARSVIAADVPAGDVLYEHHQQRTSSSRAPVSVGYGVR